MLLRFLAVLLTCCALLPIQALAESSDCGSPVVLIPDGRITPSTIPANTTYWFGIYAQAGHSYSVEFEPPADNYLNSSRPQFAAIAVFGPYDSLRGCRGTSTVPMTANSGYAPTISKNGDGGGRRVSFIATTSGLYLIAATNVMGAGTYTFRAMDTSLFCPRWTTRSGADVQWGLSNLSDMTITGILIILDANGQIIYTTALNIPPGGRINRSTGAPDMNLGREAEGSAIFTHNGPPNAVLGDAMLIYPNGGTPFPLKFETLSPR